jgi:hypothetical protein
MTWPSDGFFEGCWSLGFNTTHQRRGFTPGAWEYRRSSACVQGGTGGKAEDCPGCWDWMSTSSLLSNYLEYMEYLKIFKVPGRCLGLILQTWVTKIMETWGTTGIFIVISGSLGILMGCNWYNQHYEPWACPSGLRDLYRIYGHFTWECIEHDDNDGIFWVGYFRQSHIG